jgi:hypothetical protein
MGITQILLENNMMRLNIWMLAVTFIIAFYAHSTPPEPACELVNLQLDTSFFDSGFEIELLLKSVQTESEGREVNESTSNELKEIVLIGNDPKHELLCELVYYTYSCGGTVSKMGFEIVCTCMGE